jgi:hypothetical protein
MSYVKNKIGNWIQFTPTGTWTGNTVYTGFYRRNGDCIDVRYKLTFSDTPTPGVQLKLDLPLGLTWDSTKVTTSWAGEGTHRNEGTAYSTIHAYLIGTTSQITVHYNNASAGFTDLTPTAPNTLNSPDTLDITVFNLPIAGW